MIERRLTPVQQAVSTPVSPELHKGFVTVFDGKLIKVNPNGFPESISYRRPDEEKLERLRAIYQANTDGVLDQVENSVREGTHDPSTTRINSVSEVAVLRDLVRRRTEQQNTTKKIIGIGKTGLPGSIVVVEVKRGGKKVGGEIAFWPHASSEWTKLEERVTNADRNKTDSQETEEEQEKQPQEDFVAYREKLHEGLENMKSGVVVPIRSVPTIFRQTHDKLPHNYVGFEDGTVRKIDMPIKLSNKPLLQVDGPVQDLDTFGDIIAASGKKIVSFCVGKDKFSQEIDTSGISTVKVIDERTIIVGDQDGNIQVGQVGADRKLKMKYLVVGDVDVIAPIKNLQRVDAQTVTYSHGRDFIELDLETGKRKVIHTIHHNAIGNIHEIHQEKQQIGENEITVTQYVTDKGEAGTDAPVGVLPPRNDTEASSPQVNKPSVGEAFVPVLAKKPSTIRSFLRREKNKAIGVFKRTTDLLASKAPATAKAIAVIATLPMTSLHK